MQSICFPVVVVAVNCPVPLIWLSFCGCSDYLIPPSILLFTCERCHSVVYDRNLCLISFSCYFLYVLK